MGLRRIEITDLKWYDHKTGCITRFTSTTTRNEPDMLNDLAAALHQQHQLDLAIKNIRARLGKLSD